MPPPRVIESNSPSFAVGDHVLGISGVQSHWLSNGKGVRKVDPAMAPPGKHVMSCFVQYAPYHLNGGWTDEKRDAFGRTVIDQIADYSPDFKDLLLHAEIRTPREIEDEVGLTQGNIFQGELTIDQLFFNRPFPGYGQYRMPLKNLYMCGSSTHPGGGVSAACGANAAREILR